MNTKLVRRIGVIVVFLLLLCVSLYLSYADNTEDAGAAGKDGKLIYSYEDNQIEASVEAEPGVLDSDAQLHVSELDGQDKKEAKEFAGVMSSVTEEVSTDKEVITGARAYDIYFTDASGKRIEPSGDVEVTLKYRKPVDLSGDADTTKSGIAHIRDNGKVETIEADFDRTKSGRIKSADFTTDSFSIYVVFDTAKTETTGTSYLIRYYHADGTYDQREGTLTASDNTVSFSSEDTRKYAGTLIRKDNETYSGMTITTGNKSVTANASTGTGTVSYDSGTRLVKVNIYYKEVLEEKTGGTVSGAPKYDTKTDASGNKTYDTGTTGLHTDKTATVNSSYDDKGELYKGRTFDLELEAWNIGSNIANVGMVFDASGSMVWASNAPQPLKVSSISDSKLPSVLDITKTDNTKLNYNSYQYYILDDTDSVREYVPLGFYDGSATEEKILNNKNVKVSTNYGFNFPYGTGAGWYYVNSSNYYDYTGSGTAKQYSGYPSEKSSNPSSFYVGSDGYLHCKYYYKGKVNGQEVFEHDSIVYVKPDDADTKSEVLQNAVARFAATLNSMSPQSLVGMTRFSRDDFTSAQLALLNWTTDTTLITAAMNQSYGTSPVSGTSTATIDGMTVYNYGFTGATHTYKGIGAFIDDLTSGSSYTPTKTNGNSSKYLIIFTDGKDNSGKEAQSQTYATNLKNQGYTIFTVLMQSAGMDSDDVSNATTFLQSLSGTKTEGGATKDSDGNYKYFFSSMYDEPEKLVASFQKIATEIAGPLEDYTIKDYIDPRFDVLNEFGEVVTTLNEDGTFTQHRIVTSDGKDAMLKYDSDKKMFYIEVSNQDIPTSPKNATKVQVNSTTITVRAKEDLIGGNDILTNGNASGQNSVYDPNDSSNPKKDFPRTTANPKNLTPKLKNYEDTIFLGEDITPSELYNKIRKFSSDDSSKWFMEYLKRIGVKAHNDENYYLKLLTGQSTDYSDQYVTYDQGNKKLTITVPYYYLEEPGDDSSYAGGTLHQNDQIGTLTYVWQADDTGGNTLSDNNAFKKFTTEKTADVKYHLTVTYAADAFSKASQYDNNGSDRTRTLTSQTNADNSTILIRSARSRPGATRPARR